MSGEMMFDMVIDLFVYVEKYWFYFVEELDEGILFEFGFLRLLSDYDVNFDMLVDCFDFSVGLQGIDELICEIVVCFDMCWCQVEVDVVWVE